jgi:hypothetical protein
VIAILFSIFYSYDNTDDTSRLTILDTIPEDEGEYMVKAVNDKGGHYTIAIKEYLVSSDLPSI